MQLLRRSAGVEDADPVRLARREGEIAFAHALVKPRRFEIDPVGQPPLADASQSLFNGKVEEYDKIGAKTAGGQFDGGFHLVER